MARLIYLNNTHAPWFSFCAIGYILGKYGILYLQGEGGGGEGWNMYKGKSRIVSLSMCSTP